MKKFIVLLISSTLSIMTLVSCKDNDQDNPYPDIPTISEDVYILSQGNFYQHIDGGMYTFDYESATLSSNVFKEVNKIGLGDTPQCGICYGSKIYVGVYNSKCIQIMDKESLKSIKNLTLADRDNGNSPRSIIADKGYLYISLYEGYVARLDTLTLTIDKTIKVGPNPETMAIYEGKIYVPNSDGMNPNIDWNNPEYGKTASVIDINTFEVESTIEVPENPTVFASNKSGLYLLSMGNYANVDSKLYRMRNNDFEEIAPATIFAVDEENVYCINNPYSYFGIQDPDYCKYNPSTGICEPWNFPKVKFPASIGIDKVGKKVVVVSYQNNGGTAAYDANSMLNVYTMDGAEIGEYPIGVGPAAIFFNNK